MSVIKGKIQTRKESQDSLLIGSIHRFIVVTPTFGSFWNPTIPWVTKASFFYMSE